MYTQTKNQIRGNMLSDIDVLNTLKFMNQNSKLIKLKLDQGNLEFGPLCRPYRV